MKLFGTDGIRGKANSFPITPELALLVGKAVAKHCGAAGSGSCRAVLGKDTRLSGYMLESAISAGLLSMGMDVLQVGPMPTPAVARLTQSFAADCGIMITASHNPSEDNGIKIFDRFGFKLTDYDADAIENLIADEALSSAHIANSMIGKAKRIDDARGRYIEFAKGTIGNRSLAGLKLVLDCANGAAYSMAPGIFRELGAEVIADGVSPDGVNINFGCGATVPNHLAELVKKYGADAGIALDGDADRVIFCDATGSIVDGDRIIGMAALDYRRRNRLAGNAVVVTVMSNLGLRQALEQAGIEVIVTDVGDHRVIEAMRERKCNLGGEQSGHVIFMDYVTTGDGIITALHVLRIMKEQQKSLRELTGFMTAFPQKQLNLTTAAKIPLQQLPELTSLLRQLEASDPGNLRALVRWSGTENKLRILVEAPEVSTVEHWSSKLFDTAKKSLEVR